MGDQEQAFLDKIAGAATFYEKDERYFRPLAAGDRPSMDHYLYTTWVTGGETGNDCYGLRESRPVLAEPEPEFTDLDDVLFRVCPNMPFLQYKRLLASGAIKYGSDESRGYYGGHTEYGTKRIKLRKLYDFLAANSLV